MNTLAYIGSAARWCVRRVLRLYYPVIEIEGRERLPASGAVLFVANHPNSLMDPALIGFTAQRPVHFFAKAPLFDVPVFGALMNALGMVPAYRGMDDKASVRRNLETLEIGAEHLRRGESVGIFPEGKSHDREGLEQVRTGAARIAWQAARDGGAVTIVPLGLNYERKERFCSAVWVRVGQPINGADWFRNRGEEEKKAIRGLTEEIDRHLKLVVIHINEERWQSLLYDLETLLPTDDNASPSPIAYLRHRKRLADAMNYYLATDRPAAESVATAIEQHRTQLAAAGLTMDSPVFRFGLFRLTSRLLLEAVWLLLRFIPAVCGLLHHIVPFAITRGIVRLVKYPGRTTIATNRLTIGLPVYAICYAVVWWLLAKATSAWIAWLWTALMPLAGISALHFFSKARQSGRAWRHEVTMLFRARELRRLRQEQAGLRRKLEHLRDDFRARNVMRL